MTGGAPGIRRRAVQVECPGRSLRTWRSRTVALCTALNIPIHEHHDAVGIDKSGIKAKMRALKKDRDAALDAGDHEKLKAVRRNIHGLNRQIKQHLV